MFRQNSNCKYGVTTPLWFDDSKLKTENYNLNTELNKLKKRYELLQQEKKELANRLAKVENQKSNQVMPTNIVKLPDEVENVLAIIGVELGSMILPKIENLLRCTTCIVCQENIKSVMFLDCRHLAMCELCSKTTGDTCPLCRKISKKVNIYL